MTQPQQKIAARYMRGGTSKGVFFNLNELPASARSPGAARDRLLMRIIGSPDPYGQQIDGMGGATSSTSKTVIVAPSQQPGHDVDYLFGQVAITRAGIDWSGNCGNLTAAVGAFAIDNGLIAPQRLPDNGFCEVRIWQQNIGKTIIARVPVRNGQVQESGDFELDGVAFPGAEIRLEFLDPADADGDLFPTGQRVDELQIPGIGCLPATLINAGIATIFVNASDLGYSGCELQHEINNDPQALARLETIRAWGALKMGLIDDIHEAASRQHTPKLAFVAAPQSYTSASGKHIDGSDIDLCVRALSMGKLHHAMMGTASVAIASAAAIPGTLVNQVTANAGQSCTSVTFGHASGILTVGAEAHLEQGRWQVKKAAMSRSARLLMEGWVRVPADYQ